MGHPLSEPEAQEILTGNREIQGSPAEPGAADTRFQPGRSGNPAGRPPGARNRATVLREAALTERSVAVMEDVLAKAEAGDLGAARLVLARLLPTGLGVGVELAPATSAADIVEAIGRLAAATAAGEVSPAQANAITRLLQLQLQALQARAKEAETTAETEALIRALRAQAASRAKPGTAPPPAAPARPPAPQPPKPACQGRLVPMAEWRKLNGLEQSLPAALARVRAASG